MLYFILILFSAPKINAVTIDIDAGIDLGPQWKYEYKIKPQADQIHSPQFRAQRKNIMTDMAVAAGSKIFDIIKNIQFDDVKSDEYKVAAEFNDQTDNPTTEQSDKINLRERDTKNSGYREERVIKKKHLRDIDTEEENHKRGKDTKKSVLFKKDKISRETESITTKENSKEITESETSESESESKQISIEPHKEKATSIKIERAKLHEPTTTTEAKHIERGTTKNLVTSIVPRNDVDIFVKPVRVKDDPALTEHIQHIYKQSLKVFEDLKNKVDNYKLKNEIKFLARSYDEKYKEFVKENKYHHIKSRLGKKKVILNAAETSNKILNRLIGYLKSKVEKQGLRSNVPNVFERELNKKIHLENKRMCKKFGVCRAGEGFRQFMIDALTIILNTDDRKIKIVNDAFTEVLKNRDFSKVMDAHTEKLFLRGIRTFENYNVDVLKPILYIVRNVLVNINEPLKVTNRDKSVNKTVAFIEIMDLFEEKMPPNEENRLSWEDTLNTLRSWSNNERYDIIDMIETFVDHVKKNIDTFDNETANRVERNLLIVMK